MNIMILGHKGMLGDAVYRFYQKSTEYTLTTTDLRWPSIEFKNFILQSKVDAIINCIGAIPNKYKDFSINIYLPLFLLSTNTIVINPGTDISDDSEYSFSKNIISDLSNKIDNLYTIQCSIIGMGGLLKSIVEKNLLYGYTNHYWNGITTIEWAKISLEVINRKIENKIIIPSTKCITKFELSNLIIEKFKIKHQIIPQKKLDGADRCLDGNLLVNDIEYLLDELIKYYK